MGKWTAHLETIFVVGVPTGRNATVDLKELVVVRIVNQSID